MHYTYEEIKNTDKFGEAWWAYFIRPIVYKLTFFFANYTNITPTQITIMSFIFGILAAYSFSNRTRFFLLTRALLFELSYILDCTDGRMASLKGLKSIFGAYVYIMTDFTKYFFIVLCLAYGQ